MKPKRMSLRQKSTKSSAYRCKVLPPSGCLPLRLGEMVPGLLGHGHVVESRGHPACRDGKEGGRGRRRRVESSQTDIILT